MLVDWTWARFQFHKGTINTYAYLIVYNSFKIFQFHKGTINTIQNRVIIIMNPNFNSIKVRLIHR
jgi:hypothetical protein